MLSEWNTQYTNGKSFYYEDLPHTISKFGELWPTKLQTPDISLLVLIHCHQFPARSPNRTQSIKLRHVFGGEPGLKRYIEIFAARVTLIKTNFLFSCEIRSRTLRFHPFGEDEVDTAWNNTLSTLTLSSSGPDLSSHFGLPKQTPSK